MKRIEKRWTNWLMKPHVVFLILASFFGTLSAVMVPQLTVNDENMHFIRAYNLASSSLGNKDCAYPHDIGLKAGSVYTDTVNANYTQTVNLSDVRESTCGSAASYTPIMHIPQSIGIFASKVTYPSSALMVLLGRLANLAFYIAAVYFIIQYVRIGKWVFVVVALLPSIVHMAASLSGDAMNNILVFAIIALILNFFIQKTQLSRKQIGLLLLVAGLLSLTKVTNILLLTPFLFLPTGLFAKNKATKVPFNIRKWLLLAGVGTIGVVLLFTWQKIYGTALIGPSLENPIASNPLGFIEILINTYISPFFGYNDLVLRGVVGEFASFAYHLPTFVIILLFALLLIVFLHKDKQEEQLIRPVITPLTLSMSAILVALIVAVSYAMYVSWAIQPFRFGPSAPYADGVQGRYFTAFIVLLIPLFIWLRKYISVSTKSPKTLGLVVFSISGFALAFYIVETYLFIT